MPIKQANTPYPLIDSDPHASRVIRYMRPSDYAVWAGGVAAAPALLLGWEKVDPTFSRGGTRSATKLLGFLGFCGGFMLAYQRSSFRFMGLSPNEPEVAKDTQELSARVAAGKPVYGETDLSPYLQGVAARNSTWSQLKMGLIPWFNLVNHNQHGVDTAKYGQKESSSS